MLNIQQYKRTMQQKGTCKHQQFERLEGNTSPAVPLTSQTWIHSATVSALYRPNLSIWSSNQQQRSNDHSTDFLLIKADLDRAKTARFFISTATLLLLLLLFLPSPTRVAWEAPLRPYMMKLKQRRGGKTVQKSYYSWLESHLEVVDFLRCGCPVALLQRGSADQRGELRIRK